MPPHPSSDATTLLQEGRRGHKESLDELLSLVYEELRSIAHRLLQKRPAGGMLQTTALVHEAYLKLIDQSEVEWEDRAHFQALTARAMRQILIDHFRRQTADKRGGSTPDLSLEEGTIPIEDRGSALLALDEALSALSDRDTRQAQVVMYRFYGGMSQRAIASVLGVSTRTIRRDWRKAKAWLSVALEE